MRWSCDFRAISDYKTTSQNSNVCKRSQSLALSGNHRADAPLLRTKGAEAEGQTDTEVDRALLREGGGRRIPMQSVTQEKVPLLTARHLAASA